MNLETWIREHLTQTVRDPWPHGNGTFCALLDTLIEHRQQKHFVRNRGQGTTTLLMAAALYAAGAKQVPYTLLLFRDLHQSRCLAKVLRWLADGADLQLHKSRDGSTLCFVAGGIVECRSIRQGLSGLAQRLDGRIVRPALALLDMSERPHSEAQSQQLRERVMQAHQLHSDLSPCAVAVADTTTAWSH